MNNDQHGTAQAREHDAVGAAKEQELKRRGFLAPRRDTKPKEPTAQQKKAKRRRAKSGRKTNRK